MTKRKGIIYASIERLNSLMALKESRYQAKQALRASGEHVWSFSTGKIHSLTTRTVYQQHALAFVNWTREHYAVRHLEQLDARADELATQYLTKQLMIGRSPFTVQTERAALRMFFSNCLLASSIILPPRRREQIHRSRGPVAQDREFQPDNWQKEIAFLQSCGLRRSEAMNLCVKDIMIGSNGQVDIFVAHGKGGRSRTVPVLPGHEEYVIAVIVNRLPEEKVFTRLPVRLDIHALRREYAQALYLHYAPDRQLPSSRGRLKPHTYDERAAMKVSAALGHNRLDVMLRHYLR
jgi:integrase